jgi:hypothetical protein
VYSDLIISEKFRIRVDVNGQISLWMPDAYTCIFSILLKTTRIIAYAQIFRTFSDRIQSSWPFHKSGTGKCIALNSRLVSLIAAIVLL